MSSTTVPRERTEGQLLTLVARLIDQVWTMHPSQLFADEGVQGLGMGFPKGRVILLSEDRGRHTRLEHSRHLQVY